jgi:multiple sugar transport system ATP-binding protein
MGRSIVRNPQVFLFDEPLSNLDAKLRVAMRAEIKSLHRRLATTTIYVTHDQVEAMTMADEIVVMNNGRVEQIGTPLELYDRPRNTFVASFIGSPSMNMIAGSFDTGSEGPMFAATGGGRFPLPPSRTYPAGASAIYGLRPEYLSLVRAGEGLAAKIIVVEPLGSETQVLMSIGEQQIVGVFRERITAQPDETLWIRPALDQISLFAGDSGERLEA